MQNNDLTQFRAEGTLYLSAPNAAELIRRNFALALHQLLVGKAYVGIATHDELLVWESLRTLSRSGATVIASAAGSGELQRLGWDTLPQHISLPLAG